jgi:hypothetical protein
LLRVPYRDAREIRADKASSGFGREYFPARCPKRDNRSTVRAPVDLPTTFLVGARVGKVNGGGRLVVDVGTLAFESDRLTARFSGVEKVVHRGTRVVFVKARLVPPWFNTSVVLASELPVHVVTWLGARARLLGALQAAGFQVEQVETWFSLTGQRARPMPPE